MSEGIKRSRRYLDKLSPIKKCLVECVCPLCPPGKTHKVNMEWTGGDMMPRIYCRLHKLSVASATEG